MAPPPPPPSPPRPCLLLAHLQCPGHSRVKGRVRKSHTSSAFPASTPGGQPQASRWWYQLCAAALLSATAYTGFPESPGSGYCLECEYREEVGEQWLIRQVALPFPYPLFMLIHFPLTPLRRRGLRGGAAPYFVWAGSGWLENGWK